MILKNEDFAVVLSLSPDVVSIVPSISETIIGPSVIKFHTITVNMVDGSAWRYDSMERDKKNLVALVYRWMQRNLDV